LQLAIFGGTFDPIHSAHLKVAREAANGFGLDRVLFIPAGRPPHKAGGTHAAFEHRVRMVELACEAEPNFAVSRIEEHTVRSYSIDTIERLRAAMPGAALSFVIGADAFAELRTWHRWRDVAKAVRFLVLSRPGSPYDVPAGVNASRLDTLHLPISSSDIRRALQGGERPPEVPAAVLAYILEHGLYGTGRARSAQ
jgi:nicotinate-nucleotide adenylyltransferase